MHSNYYFVITVDMMYTVRYIFKIYKFLIYRSNVCIRITVKNLFSFRLSSFALNYLSRQIEHKT